MHGIRSIDQTGMWTNIDCYNSYPYICKVPAIFENEDPAPTLCTGEGFTSWDDYYQGLYICLICPRLPRIPSLLQLLG